MIKDYKINKRCYIKNSDVLVLPGPAHHLYFLIEIQINDNAISTPRNFFCNINEFKLTFFVRIFLYAYGICSDQLLFKTLITTLKIYNIFEDDIEGIYVM